MKSLSCSRYDSTCFNNISGDSNLINGLIHDILIRFYIYTQRLIRANGIREQQINTECIQMIIRIKNCVLMLRCCCVKVDVLLFECWCIIWMLMCWMKVNVLLYECWCVVWKWCVVMRMLMCYVNVDVLLCECWCVVVGMLMYCTDVDVLLCAC